MSFIGFGAMVIDVTRGDEKAYCPPLNVPSTVPLEQAIEEAREFYDELIGATSGAKLLEIANRALLPIVGLNVFTEIWPARLAVYEDIERQDLERIARRIAKRQENYSRHKGTLSLLVYALRGLAAELDLEEVRHRQQQCAYCYRIARLRSKYCCDHGTSRERRAENTKLEVERRRAPGVKELALSLRRADSSIYAQLYCSLKGMTGGIEGAPPPLEEMEDDQFATGERIGVNGAAWLLFLWQVLPRVCHRLGEDWLELVRDAIDERDWDSVLERLREIDKDDKTTDAHKWVLKLIDAEAWWEAEEMARERRRRPGRPTRSLRSPQIQAALKQLSGGTAIEEVARQADVHVSTVYRWKKEAAAKTVPMA